MNLTQLSEEIKQVSDKYSQKYNIDRDSDWYVLKLQEELGELIQAYLMMRGQARTKGKSPAEIKSDFANEVGDVLGHVLLLVKHFNIDIAKVMDEKWLKWNK